MKKFLLIILFMTMPAYAFENYMIIAKDTVVSAKIEDEKIAYLKPVFTIDNDKKIIVLIPKQTGKTKILITQNDGTKNIDITVNDAKTILSKMDGFQYFQIDNPPEYVEILIPPPTLKKEVE